MIYSLLRVNATFARSLEALEDVFHFIKLFNLLKRCNEHYDPKCAISLLEMLEGFEAIL